MDQTESAGFSKAQFLIIFAVLAAALLVGAAAYFSVNSAAQSIGRIGNTSSVLAGALPQGQAALDGSAAAQATSPAHANGSVATGSGGEAQVPITGSTASGAASTAGQDATQKGANATAAPKEVVIDFLYADWCSHCQKMKPIVAALEQALPKERFAVRYWNEASRASSPETSAIYTAYTRNGYFQGYPTFVANGNDYRVGEMPEATLKAWVCSKFSAPKPAGC